MEFWKLILKENGVLEIRVLNIKLRNWSFENYLKIGILDNYLKIEFLKIKFENWKFRKLNFDIKIWRIKKRWNVVIGLHAKGGLQSVGLNCKGIGFNISFSYLLLQASNGSIAHLLVSLYPQPPPWQGGHMSHTACS